MSKRPWFPFYVTDYEGDTAHLTPEEDLVYMRLLRLCWKQPCCSLPNDTEWLMRHLRIAGEVYEQALRIVLDEFFILNRKKRLENNRLKALQGSAKKVSEKNAEKGRKSASLRKARKNKEIEVNHGSTDAQPNANDPYPYPEPDSERKNKQKELTDFGEPKDEPPNDDFDKFWDAYPRRRGKATARKAWDKAIKKTDQWQLISAAQEFKTLCSQQGTADQFVPYPATWLNGQQWEDNDRIRDEIQSRRKQIEPGKGQLLAGADF